MTQLVTLKRPEFIVEPLLVVIVEVVLVTVVVVTDDMFRPSGRQSPFARISPCRHRLHPLVSAEAHPTGIFRQLPASKVYCGRQVLQTPFASTFAQFAGIKLIIQNPLTIEAPFAHSRQTPLGSATAQKGGSAEHFIMEFM